MSCRSDRLSFDVRVCLIHPRQAEVHGAADDKGAPRTWREDVALREGPKGLGGGGDRRHLSEVTQLAERGFEGRVGADALVERAQVVVGQHAPLVRADQSKREIQFVLSRHYVLR